MKYCTKYLNVSSDLIKILIKDEKINLLDIIFSYFKFYDNDFILKLLFYYKNKITISTFDLNQQISNEKFNISINTKDPGLIYKNFYNNNINKYLLNECDKKDVNIYIIKYLVEHGADIDKEDMNGITPLFNACKNRNETTVKYLMEHGSRYKQREYGK